VLESFNNILGIIESCNALSNSYAKDGKVENAGDYVMDAQILKMSHDLLGTTSEKMGNCDFSEEEFIQALVELMSKEGGNNKLNEMASECCKAAHFTISLYGACDIKAPPPQEKVQKERQKATKEIAKVKAPENVKQLSRKDQGAEKINAVRNEIFKICKKRQKNSLPYFELICDPQSFMKTVDAAFQISFLVRDGFLGLKLIGNEQHVFIPEKKAEPNKKSNQETKQCVMSINPAMWQQKIEQFKLKQPLLKLDMTMEAENEEHDGEELMETDSE
jgi:non-structural maintenance of chromosomes element 4